MRRIPCDCSGCVDQLSKPWLPNLEKTQQPRYVIEPETVDTLQSHMAIIIGILSNLIKIKKPQTQMR